MDTINLLWKGVLGAICLTGMVHVYDKATKQIQYDEIAHQIKPLAPPTIDKPRLCKKSPSCRKMAEAVVYEARSEPLEGQYAVAWVIRNRVEAARWPDSIIDVVHQPKQFSYLQDKHKQKTPTEKDWTVAYEVSYDVLTYKVASPVGGATHYHTVEVRPRWAQHLDKVGQINRHIFYTES